MQGHNFHSCSKGYKDLIIKQICYRKSKLLWKGIEIESKNFKILLKDFKKP